MDAALRLEMPLLSALRIPDKDRSTPPEIRERYRAHYQEHLRRRRVRRVEWVGIAAGIAAALSAATWFAWPTAGVETLAHSGEVRVFRGGTTQGIETGDRIRAGDTLEVGARSRVRLAAGPAVALAVEGPAALEFTALDLSRAALQLRVATGTVALRADPAQPHSVELIARGVRYRLLGTSIRLTVREGEQSLAVLEGRVAVATSDGSQEVGAGEQLQIPKQSESGPLPRVRPLTATERARHELALVDNETPEEPEFQNLDEIRARYGSLSRVTLTDGTVLIGFYLREGSRSWIITPRGKIPIETHEIAQIELNYQPAQ